MPLKILCFGDSNTWGYVPGSFEAETGAYDRYDESNRWPCLLGALLERSGISCAITEDAVPGRTIDIEHAGEVELNGKAVLTSKHLEHLPDYKLIIIVLGVNDLKSTYHRTGEEIAASFMALIEFIKTASPETEIILPVTPKITKEDGFGTDFAGAAPKSDELRTALLRMGKTGLFHLTKLEYELNPIDGVHFSAGDNRRLADALGTQIQLLLKPPSAAAPHRERKDAEEEETSGFGCGK